MTPEQQKLADKMLVQTLRTKESMVILANDLFRDKIAYEAPNDDQALIYTVEHRLEPVMDGLLLALDRFVTDIKPIINDVAQRVFPVEQSNKHTFEDKARELHIPINVPTWDGWTLAGNMLSREGHQIDLSTTRAGDVFCEDLLHFVFDEIRNSELTNQEKAGLLHVITDLSFKHDPDADNDDEQDDEPEQGAAAFDLDSLILTKLVANGGQMDGVELVRSIHNVRPAPHDEDGDDDELAAALDRLVAQGRISSLDDNGVYRVIQREAAE